MSCFRLENVSYRYSRSPVLTGLDLSLEPGEILGLFGHNGAGKTTSIKLILGLMTPQQGRVTVLDGHAGHPDVSQHIGYLPENVMFYPQLTGREILAHFARLKGAAAAQVPELLDQVGLSDAMDARLKTYSKGMRQRLGLAQALLGRPRLLMLDEPTVGLDPVATADLYQLLRELRAEGTGIVLCSHVLPGVEPYIDRAAILTGGSLQACGDLTALRRQAQMPVTLTVTPKDRSEPLLNALPDVGPWSPRSLADGRVQLAVAAENKMSALKYLMDTGAVQDLTLSEPSLEDLYVHFIGSGGLAHRGGAR